jgi:hypothetical protein
MGVLEPGCSTACGVRLGGTNLKRAQQRAEHHVNTSMLKLCQHGWLLVWLSAGGLHWTLVKLLMPMWCGRCQAPSSAPKGHEYARRAGACTLTSSSSGASSGSSTACHDMSNM